ncbi:MAG: transketolase [Bacteroidota bacterium]
MSATSVNLARDIRATALKMVYEANASHIGGAFSMADLLAVLYDNVLKIDPAIPKDEARDRFLLSKGHACTSLYAVLGLKGFFDLKDLDTYTKNGSSFLSHTSHKVPGVELSTGSLGHALSVSCGLALAAKRKGRSFRTFCLLSDGELDEGSNWEAILFAQQYKLDNLVAIVDYNKIQSFGDVEEVIGLSPLDKKFESFNWNVIEADGHDHADIEKAFSKAASAKGKPSVVIAHTVKGKGVDYMEHKLLWHYKSPSKEQYEEALKQLSK